MNWQPGKTKTGTIAVDTFFHGLLRRFGGFRLFMVDERRFFLFLTGQHAHIPPVQPGKIGQILNAALARRFSHIAVSGKNQRPCFLATQRIKKLHRRPVQIIAKKAADLVAADASVPAGVFDRRFVRQMLPEVANSPCLLYTSRCV